MTHLRRHLFVGLILLGASLSVGCHLGITNRPALFPNVAYSPTYARAGGYGYGPGNACGPAGCYREFGPNAGCGNWLFNGPNSPYNRGGYGAAPVVTGPVYDAPVTMMPSYGAYDLPIYGGGYSAPAPTPGCTGCGASSGGMSGIPVVSGSMSGIPIAGTVGGPPIAVSPAGGVPVGPTHGVPQVMPGGGPVHGVPFDSGMVPTLKPPPGSIPLQMPSEVKESKKITVAGK